MCGTVGSWCSSSAPSPSAGHRNIQLASKTHRYITRPNSRRGAQQEPSTKLSQAFAQLSCSFPQTSAWKVRAPRPDLFRRFIDTGMDPWTKPSKFERIDLTRCTQCMISHLLAYALLQNTSALVRLLSLSMQSATWYSSRENGRYQICRARTNSGGRAE